MKLSHEVKELCEEISDDLKKPKPNKPVNYKVKSMVHFKDGVLNTRGSTITVKATSAEEAEKIMREKVHANWKDVQKIEVMSVKKG